MKWLHDWNHFTTDTKFGFLDAGYMGLIILTLVGATIFTGFIIGNWKEYKHISFVLIGVTIITPIINFVIGCNLGKILIDRDGTGGGLFAIIMILKISLIIYIYFKILTWLNEFCDSYKKYNSIYMCAECNVYIRRGYLILNKMKGNNNCPVCDENAHMRETGVDIETNLPLSPKFNYFKCKELSDLIVKDKEDELINEQAEKYIKAQERKVEKWKNKSESNF